METFKRTPTIRMLAAEVIATIVGLQSGQKDSYQPAIYLGPTGAEVNRVLSSEIMPWQISHTIRLVASLKPGRMRRFRKITQTMITTHSSRA